ncbi:hypothetical protein C8J57DRAFT_1721155 [Mycena rebaudengoi]|nr:hypothetical protein C8J57DRAFT_1721155 [Mycena rebaudengoi]
MCSRKTKSGSRTRTRRCLLISSISSSSSLSSGLLSFPAHHSRLPPLSSPPLSSPCNLATYQNPSSPRSRQGGQHNARQQLSANRVRRHGQDAGNPQGLKATAPRNKSRCSGCKFRPQSSSPHGNPRSPPSSFRR